MRRSARIRPRLATVCRLLSLKRKVRAAEPQPHDRLGDELGYLVAAARGVC